MDRLSIVTFVSNSETVNYNILSLFKDIQKRIPLTELLIYTDNSIYDINSICDDVKLNICPHLTKYNRILKSLEDSNSAYILYLDNDIMPDFSNLYEVIDNIHDNSVDLLWGIIGVSEKQGFVSKLIIIDKILSHKIIRPTLWKMNIGISIPGQIFLLNKTKFQKDLSHRDTIFDDLTIGICVKHNNYNIKMISSVLGYEKPSTNFNKLITQRIRWAKGFYESVENNMHNKMLPLIIAHGFSYHLLGFVFWALLYMIFMFNHIVALVLWLAFCVKIADFDLSLIPFSIAYTIIFPIIHLCWLVVFVYDVIAGYISNK
ncbi:MAG: glycosyltransferase family 2 protein [Treponema sp.]|jgi:cellulose synthase/poly-beta-1,6-N-acetylglucosamine synthase-like glycosyltransferase|nr:glycosyltransferase family 2 protein [Treponema sp.]